MPYQPIQIVAHFECEGGGTIQDFTNAIWCFLTEPSNKCDKVVGIHNGIRITMERTCP
jgi:hypothetical protein